MTDDQLQLVDAHTEYAFGVLKKFRRKYPHASMVDDDELASAVWWALVKAAISNDDSKGYAFGSLLFSCVWNALINVLRVELKWEYRRGTIGDVHVAHSPNPFDSVASRDGRRYVRESVGMLATRKQLRAVYLVYFDGLTQEIAAERMGISQSSLSECLTRAHDRFRESEMMQLAWNEMRGVA